MQLNFPSQTIFPLKRGRTVRPPGVYPRQQVAELLSRRVFEMDEAFRPWCEYIAMLCPCFEWTGQQAFMQEEWADVEDFALNWQPFTEEEFEQAMAAPFVPDDEPYSGMVTTRPEGDLIIVINGRSYYQSLERHPFSLAFAERYMDDLRADSHIIHPRNLVDYSGIKDQGWMIREGRYAEAQEILRSVKMSEGDYLYIPGDGIGLYSLVARQRGLAYHSTEPGGCGKLAVWMDLISSVMPYDPDKTDGILIASQLVPYEPGVVHHTGRRVIIDQQRWYENHPQDLRIIPLTGHRVSHSHGVLNGYQPKALLRRGWTDEELKYILLKSEQLGGHLVCDDKSMLSKCALSGMMIYTQAYAGRGPRGWMLPPPLEGTYLQIGRAKKNIDPMTRADVNVLEGLSHGFSGRAPVFFGAAGERVYSPYHETSQQFKSLMVWESSTRFYKMYGQYRERVRYRASVWLVNGKDQISIRSRLVPEAVIAVIYGRAMYSAEPALEQREYRGGYWYTPVNLGAVVGRVADVQIPRSVPGHMVAKMMEQDKWPDEQTYDFMVQQGLRPSRDIKHVQFQL